MSDLDYETYARLLKALAHPTRLRIVEILQREPICVKNIGDCMDVQQANLSQHLSVLRNCGIVSTCREGNRVCYSIRDQRVVSVLEALRSEHVDSAGITS
jgi:DNA-binding transcriptional ArsR family regulator